MSLASQRLLPDRPLNRIQLLDLLNTALAVSEFRYARRVALAWLASYPGDLQVSLLHAQSLAQEERYQQALPILDKITRTDPEFLPAQKLLEQARLALHMETNLEPSGSAYVLGDRSNKQKTLPDWAVKLRMAHQAACPKGVSGIYRPYRGDVEEKGEFLSNANDLVHQVLLTTPDNLLAAVVHIQVLLSQQALPPVAILNLALRYHERWSDCVQFILILADFLMDGGFSDRAVEYLHQAVTLDVAGQVPTRMWGHDHPYRMLWPVQLEVEPGKPTSPQDLPVPAAIAARLGWNRLPHTTEEPPIGPPAPAHAPIRYKKVQPLPPFKAQPQTLNESTSSRETEKDPAVTTVNQAPETLLSVQEELEDVAKRLKQPTLARMDGRFPIYVVFTTRFGLENQYGGQNAAMLDKEMRRLVEAINTRKNWRAQLFYADDPQSEIRLASSAIQPAKPNDPWSLKLALADLDAMLGHQGEMIGSILIVGGPEVVPFHYLPNPVDDTDSDIASDNPYSTRDENYFIPEWPVGRLPGGRGNDPQVLLQSLHKIIVYHCEYTKPKPWYSKMLHFIHTAFNRLIPGVNGQRHSLGYTAAIWKKAALSVFKPIGEANAMLVSPPVHIDEACAFGANGRENHACLQMPFAKLGYFNLHGIKDSLDWFGQRDPTSPEDGADFPVALRPEDIGSGSGNGARVPQVVFSEACYGAYIQDRSKEEAIALKFLDSGSLAVIGSTCTSYGSIQSPLIAADLLGHAFWNFLGHSLPAGEALRRAKIHLAREMHRRQGYLDGEDQKTLISFVMYGDPLVQPILKTNTPRFPLRPITPPSQVHTVCDRSGSDKETKPLSPATIAQVKNLVSRYLPGMQDAAVKINREYAQCKENSHHCPTAQLGMKSIPGRMPDRKVIVLSKTILQGSREHSQFARLTLDAQGMVVKIVVSR